MVGGRVDWRIRHSDDRMYCLLRTSYSLEMIPNASLSRSRNAKHSAGALATTFIVVSLALQPYDISKTFSIRFL